MPIKASESTAWVGPAFQANLMVYGPGRYRFTGYIRIGAPLSVLVGSVAIGLIPVVWGFERRYAHTKSKQV